jgi:dTDP-4-dehydrorhamnose 3,5-epimerase
MLGRMSESWSQDEISGVFRRTLAVHADERGSFTELWRSSLTLGMTDQEFVQANLSRSRAGVLRGLHFHLRQTDLWIVLDGAVHVGLVDVRQGLAGDETSFPWSATRLSAGDCLIIPPGVAHGFWALDDVNLLYLVTREYDDSDEHGFAWNDSHVGVQWPEGEPILSGRDSSAPSVLDAVATARRSASTD